MNVPAQRFNVANPHALAAIVDASTTHHIIASQDIYDDRGTKLWAKNQPVSHSLHQRLLERKLRQPLEACLRTEDGVTAAGLHAALSTFIESNHALGRAIRPWADRLLDEATRLPLHAAVQLLLTASQATKPQVFAHAVRGMALAGAMQIHAKDERYAVRVAMLGGLLHDLGEMYVDPHYLDGSQPLDVAGYRHVVTHPRIGELLLATTTDYPRELARAIGEHHERLDGNGYPMRRAGTTLSPLGRLLAVTEVALAVVEAAPGAPLQRTSLALRIVPGEFDEACLGFFSDAAQRADEDLAAPSSGATDDMLVELAAMDRQMAGADALAISLAGRTDLSAMVRDAAAHCARLLQRLRLGWNSIGLWSASQAVDLPQGVFELGMARNELRYRMRYMARDCLWPHEEVSAKDATHLQPLWDSLSSGAPR